MTAPPPKTIEAQPVSIAWAPKSTRNFAVGCVDGRVEIHSTKKSAAPLARVWHGTRGAAAAVAWSDHGHGLYAGYGDGAVCCWDARGGGAKAWKAKGQGDAVTAMLPLFSQNLLAVGDDGGRITLRDARISGDRNPATTARSHSDYVSGLCTIRDDILVSAGADGVLAALDLRKNMKSVGETDPFEDELLSCCVTPFSVIAGTATGPLLVWSRQNLDAEPAVVASDHDSVEALVAVHDLVLTGTSDGIVRAYEHTPGKLTDIGAIGAHDDFPVEALDATFDDGLVASLSHDCVVRFFDATNSCAVRALAAAADGSASDSSDDEQPRKKKKQSESFFDGLGS